MNANLTSQQAKSSDFDPAKLAQQVSQKVINERCFGLDRFNSALFTPVIKPLTKHSSR